MLLSVMLAWMTYRLVEQPIRFAAHKAAKVGALSVAIVGVGVMGIATKTLHGLEFRSVVALRSRL